MFGAIAERTITLDVLNPALSSQRDPARRWAFHVSTNQKSTPNNSHALSHLIRAHDTLRATSHPQIGQHNTI